MNNISINFINEFSDKIKVKKRKLEIEKEIEICNILITTLSWTDAIIWVISAIVCGIGCFSIPILLLISKFKLMGYLTIIVGVLLIFHSSPLGNFLTNTKSKIETKLNNLKVEAKKI